ncbi:MAG: hypothetical protein ACQES8_00445 [Thermodesulfobacteriota bacterium]
MEAAEPYPMLDGQAIFLSEIERTTKFEKGSSSLWYEKDGDAKAAFAGLCFAADQ